MQKERIPKAEHQEPVLKLGFYSVGHGHPIHACHRVARVAEFFIPVVSYEDYLSDSPSRILRFDGGKFWSTDIVCSGPRESLRGCRKPLCR